MKETIKTAVASILFILAAGLLCTYLYKWTGLSQSFGINLNFIHWIGIVCISHIIFPSSINPRKKNDR